jgi:hypothetical protein
MILDKALGGWKLQETPNIPPRATRQRVRGFAALCAAFQQLILLRAWFDGLWRFEDIARFAA